MGLFDAARILLGPSRPPARRPPREGPLRIAMAIETVGLGGAEVVMLQLSQELRRRGHEVFPIGPEGREGWLRTSFLEDGFAWHEYRLRRPIDWQCAERYGRLLRELRSDVAHAHEFVAAVYGTAATRLAGVGHVISMHGNQQMTQKLQRRMALRWAFAHSEATVAVSHDTRRHLEGALGLPPGRVQVVHNGIPDRPGTRAKVRAELGMHDEELLVIATGSLMKRKGHLVLLEAMRLVDARGGTPAWRIAIAGEGVERVPLEAFIAAHGLAPRVSLLGNRNDIPDIQAAADVFVMPSLWEGLPLAILEAMFAANPIIATSASGIPEAITHGEHGSLVPAGDPVVLANELHRLLCDPAARRALGSRARAHAERQFSIGAMTDAYERLYRLASA
jgi:glycosyltransferase involved in cell wall biosynthesis